MIGRARTQRWPRAGPRLQLVHYGRRVGEGAAGFRSSSPAHARPVDWPGGDQTTVGVVRQATQNLQPVITGEPHQQEPQSELGSLSMINVAASIGRADTSQDSGAGLP
jgi:hypothetical protein